MATAVLKLEVARFWERASCGEVLYLSGETPDGYREQMAERYRLEPYILPFIDPERWAGKRVLEIGVGMGADHQKLAEAGAILSGVDLTARAIEHTRRRLALFGLSSDLRVADAERLPFLAATFDCVVSYGVIHHSPDTEGAAAEILRVLKPGGTFKVMIYNRHSLVGLMLWLRYGLFHWRSLTEIFARHIESDGTKGYTADEGRALFPGTDATARIELTHADLLTSAAGQRHSGKLLTLARLIWPRWFLRRYAKRFGTHLLIDGRKPIHGTFPTG